MAFTGREDHSITLEDAAKLTRNYRESAGAEAIKAGFFGKDTLQRIIDQDGCAGIRIYYGKEDDDTPQLVLVGADADENDIIRGVIAQRQIPCPPFCGKDNELNS